MSGIDTDRLERAHVLQAAAQELIDAGIGGDAVIIVSVENAELGQLDGDNVIVIGDVQLGQAATTDASAAYCAALREKITALMSDARDGGAMVSWD